MSVEFCSYCGFFHPDPNTCGPKPLEEKEFIAQLVRAGWTQAEAEQEWQSIQEEHEGGE